MQKITQVFLCAWLDDSTDVPHAVVEMSDVFRFRKDSIISAGILRDRKRCTVYCDAVHGNDVLTKNELQMCAAYFLDGKYSFVTVNFRE